MSHAQGADYILLGTLYLRGETKTHYLEQVKRHFPELYSQTLRLYQSGKLDLNYKKKFYQDINGIKAKYAFKMTAEDAVDKLKTGQQKLWKE